MTAPTTLGSARLVVPDGVRDPSAPSATVRPDQTVILGWVDIPTGVVYLQHRTRDLSTILGDATTTASAPNTTYGLALATIDGTTVLATGGADGGAIYTVTTDPLTVSPSGSYSHPVQWLRTRAMLAVDGAALIGAGQGLVSLTPTGLSVTDVGDDIIGLHRTGPTLSINDGWATTRLTSASGATIGTGPALDVSWAPMPAAATVDGWAWPAMIFDPDGDIFRVYDQAGNVTADPGWPTTLRRQAGLTGMADTPTGTILVIPHQDPGLLRTPGRFTVVHVDPTGTPTIVDDLAPDVPGFDSPVYAESPVVAVGDQTAVVIATFIEHTDDNNVGTLAWTLDLGAATHDGLLAIDTLDVPWWVVGTRDPGMAYELLIDTPLGWYVEIVAGEEHLADMELAVYDPTHEQAGADGWVVCALMRPEK